jgi:hypothetical protein
LGRLLWLLLVAGGWVGGLVAVKAAAKTVAKRALPKAPAGRRLGSGGCALPALLQRVWRSSRRWTALGRHAATRLGPGLLAP